MLFTDRRTSIVAHKLKPFFITICNIYFLFFWHSSFFSLILILISSSLSFLISTMYMGVYVLLCQLPRRINQSTKYIPVYLVQCLRSFFFLTLASWKFNHFVWSFFPLFSSVFFLGIFMFLFFWCNSFFNFFCCCIVQFWMHKRAQKRVHLSPILKNGIFFLVLPLFGIQHSSWLVVSDYLEFHGKKK